LIIASRPGAFTVVRWFLDNSNPCFGQHSDDSLLCNEILWSYTLNDKPENSAKISQKDTFILLQDFPTTAMDDFLHS